MIDRRDHYHDWAEERAAEFIPPMLTCEPVLTEACYLARRIEGGPEAVLKLLDRGVARLGFDLAEHLAAISSMMRRYAKVPMSLADACLVRLSELVADSVIFTLDSDFRVYRRHKRQQIALVIPPGR
jgi:predicted nucleic acid-binding protein